MAASLAWAACQIASTTAAARVSSGCGSLGSGTAAAPAGTAVTDCGHDLRLAWTPPRGARSSGCTAGGRPHGLADCRWLKQAEGVLLQLLPAQCPPLRSHGVSRRTPLQPAQRTSDETDPDKRSIDAAVCIIFPTCQGDAKRLAWSQARGHAGQSDPTWCPVEQSKYRHGLLSC